ncbi:hypothetical protein HJ588_00495 [Flexivirga sp. ID2601S]|uniref:Uncharacterized protein n=1 Tax=Flexivirga aerilata TaxID=1656889 RepID=A0A849AA06_9MICO|nr:hypothetical protein [Flexivirga aerilata]NNG37754.1 hypothetical protein [Flexivirga aerilata]
MSDRADGPDERPDAQPDERPDEKPPRRRPRRATRPATGGAPAIEVPVTSSDDDRPQPDEQRRTGRGAAADGQPDDPIDRWWREQRPPHWE